MFPEGGIISELEADFSAPSARSGRGIKIAVGGRHLPNRILGFGKVLGEQIDPPFVVLGRPANLRVQQPIGRLLQAVIGFPEESGIMDVVGIGVELAASQRIGREGSDVQRRVRRPGQVVSGQSAALQNGGCSIGIAD